MPPRRPSPLALAAAALAPAAFVPAAGAQTAGPRDVADNTNAWLSYVGDHAVGGRWALLPEVHLRRADAGARWQQLLLRPGVAYALAPGARLAAGYASVDSWPFGDQPAPARFHEHRLWQQLALSHATGRVGWQHRYRVEQRWVDVPLDARAHDRRYTNRARYMARATLPLRGRTVDVGEAYASAYDEAFVSWGRNVGRNVFDQNRLAGVLGWRATAGTRVEAGYLQQLVFKPDGVRMERNHTLLFTVSQSSPLLR